MSSWELENVEQAAAANPDSFFIPSAAERRAQQVGDVVRLHFVLLQEGPDLPRAERMWVEIAERSGDPPRYIGVLTNQPRSIHSLAPGDRIPFGPEHIARTIIKPTDPRWFEAAEKSAIVSRMVFEDGESVLWMYREPADREDDSGWRLFTGRETPEDLDDAANGRICNVAWLVDRDPSLDPPIRAAVGTAFERTSREAPWREILDWNPSED